MGRMAVCPACARHPQLCTSSAATGDLGIANKESTHVEVCASALGFTRNDPWQTVSPPFMRASFLSHPQLQGQPPKLGFQHRQTEPPPQAHTAGRCPFPRRQAGLCSQLLWSPRHPVQPLAPQQPQPWSTLYPPGGVSRDG